MEWRSYLWYFVSNFTEFDAKKLFKLYRHASKKDGKTEDSGEESQGKKSPSQGREEVAKEHKKKKQGHGHHKDKERRKSHEERRKKSPSQGREEVAKEHKKKKHGHGH